MIIILDVIIIDMVRIVMSHVQRILWRCWKRAIIKDAGMAINNFKEDDNSNMSRLLK